MKENSFVERRRECRLPFYEKVIFTTGTETVTAYSCNLSRGGIFLTTLNPFPLDTAGFLALFLPKQTSSLCLKAHVKHIVFDRQRCDVECGMGVEFADVNESHQALLNLHILNDQTAYMEFKKVLLTPEPEAEEIAKYVQKLPALNGMDLLQLRYRVNRICTLFEPTLDSLDASSKDRMSA